MLLEIQRLRAEKEYWRQKCQIQEGVAESLVVTRETNFVFLHDFVFLSHEKKAMYFALVYTALDVAAPVVRVDVDENLENLLCLLLTQKKVILRKYVFTERQAKKVLKKGRWTWVSA